MPVPTADRPTPGDARSLLFAFLFDGLVAIRNMGTPRSSTEDLELVHYLADWMHNWPSWIDSASSLSDFEDIWIEASRGCHPAVRKWALMMLQSYGVSLRELGLPEI